MATDGGKITINAPRISDGMVQFANHLNDFESYLNNISNEVNNVAGKSWIGDVATAFQEVFIKIDENLKNAVKNFSDTVENIKQMANETNRIQEEGSDELKRMVSFVAKY